MIQGGALAAEILGSLEPDKINGRWSQVKGFGRVMAVELEIGELLNAIVRAVKPEVVVETGTHKGFSALMIAQALQANGSGHLYTIDQVDYNVAEKCRAFGLKDRVTIVTSSSVAALIDLAARLPRIDFLWLDADHSTCAVLEELDAARPSIRPGSYIAFHDTLSKPTEDRAVRLIRKEHPQWEYIRFCSSRGFDLMRVPK